MFSPICGATSTKAGPGAAGLAVIVRPRRSSLEGRGPDTPGAGGKRREFRRPSGTAMWRLVLRRPQRLDRRRPSCEGRRRMTKIKVDEPGRRARRRRDDPDHLGLHQAEADPALSRHRPEVLRPRRRGARPHRRPDHRRRGERHQAVRRRREVRDDHPRRGAGRGVRPQADVEVAERHHPQHPRRGDLPPADHLPQRAAAGAGLDQADRRRPPRLRRPVPRHRLRLPRQGHGDAEVRRRGRRRSSSARCSRRRAAA